MRSKSPNLKVSLPKCRNCGRHWRPAQGVVATNAYCKSCSTERKAAATTRLGLRRITPEDFTGVYLLPRKLRPSRP